MANKTHIDQLIDFKEDIISLIETSQPIMGLVFDDPNIDMSSDQVFNVRDTNIYDHSYSDETVQTDKVQILVESEMVKVLSNEYNTFHVIIQVIVARNYMKLDSKRFKGLRGNRRDNVIRYIDLLLHDQRFSLGQFKLIDCGPVDVPKGFTSMRMVYSCDDFSRNRRLS